MNVEEMFQILAPGSEKPDSPLTPVSPYQCVLLLLACLSLAEPLMAMVYAIVPRVPPVLSFFFFMTFSHFRLLSSKLRKKIQDSG